MSRFASILSQLSIPAYPRRSLSVGCGAFLEYGDLGAFRPDWLHLGLDQDRVVLRKRLPVIVAEAPYFPFACLFALVIVRHPELDKTPENWRIIFDHLPPLIAPGGFLLITTYTYAEYQVVIDYISRPAYPLDLVALAPPDLVGSDRYVLAFKAFPKFY